MAQQTVNIGTTANDGTGDQLRTAFDKLNDNFVEVYTGVATVVRQTAPSTLVGDTGDVAGMIAMDSTSLYICFADYDGVSTIWFQINDTANDAHIADATIHYTEASIDHTAITNVGTNTHAQIDTHIADGTLHFLRTNIVKASPPASALGASGDLAGMIAYDTSYFYVCTADYDGATSVWRRVAVATW